MRTRLQIINSALARLGERRLDTLDDGSIDEGSQLTETCFDVYGPVRDALLTGYPWTGQITETKSTGREEPRAPAQERWVHVPDWPGLDIVLAVYIADKDTVDRPVLSETRGWVHSGGVIRSEHQYLWIKSQRPIIEEAQHPLFDEALIAALASELAMNTTFDVPTANMMERRAMKKMNDARRVDAQGKPTARIRDLRLIKARQGGTARERTAPIATSVPGS